jgi:hypothetical protein
MNVKCAKCGVELKAKDDLAGKTAKCPKCGNVIRVPESVAATAKPTIPPATDRQREYATSLGIEFPPDINRKDLSEMIDLAVQHRDEERYKKLDQLGDRESEAWQKMREEVLAEIDEHDCRLSKAEPSQMVQELANRNRGGILISFDLDEVVNFDDLSAVNVNISFSDDALEEGDVRSVLIWIGATMLGQSQEQRGSGKQRRTGS